MAFPGVLQSGFRRLIRVRAADAHFFNPHAALKHQIELAAHSLAGELDEIEFALDKGKTVAGAVGKANIAPVIHRVAASARLAGFIHGAKISKAKLPSDYGYKIKTVASKRAAAVQKMMRRTSKKVLNSTPDSQYVTGKNRAMAAAEYEAARQYFRGMADALQGGGFGKSWLTSSASPCNDCQDNEDDGVIAMGDMFSSGHMAPALHLHCMCYLGVEPL